MITQPDCILKLVNKFSKLPGVGQKTAMRYAYAVIDMPAGDAAEFCDAIAEVKAKVRFCARCGNLTDKEVCEICQRRDGSVICVVAYPKDVISIERAGGFKGVYHVLHGTLSPIDGRGPDQLNIKTLLDRLEGVNEVIMATNPDVEGEATALYIARLLKPLGVKVTRLAQGISLGSDIEYTDEVTLIKALERRTEL